MPTIGMAIIAPDAARRGSQAGALRGVAEQRLQEQREHRKGAVHSGHDDRRHGGAHPEIAVPKNTQVDDGLRRAQFAHDQRQPARTIEITLNQAIQALANQSSCCPLSRTICRVASQMVSSPKPIASIVPGRAFLI